jgi:hypothetical protein
MNGNSDFFYDDDDAIRFIKKNLPEELKNKFSEDAIHSIINLIYDFYDAKGFPEEGDDDTEVEINEDEVVAFVVKHALSGGEERADDVAQIVRGEMDYCESIGMFE